MLDELKDFFEAKEMEWRGDTLVMWLDPDDLQEFAELLGSDMLGEGRIEMALCPGGIIAIEMNEVARRLDVEPHEILPRD